MNLDVHLYKCFFARRYITLTIIVKVRISSPKTAQSEQRCADHFSKYHWDYYAQEGLLCASILRFFSAASDGATAGHQIPNRTFSSIS